MRTMDEQKVANPPFQKIEDVVRTTRPECVVPAAWLPRGVNPLRSVGAYNLCQCAGSFAAVCCGGGSK